MVIILFFKLKKSFYLGLVLIFLSGILYNQLVSVTIVHFGGQIYDENDNPIQMKSEHYLNAFIFIVYSIPLLATGLWLIKKYRYSIV